MVVAMSPIEHRIVAADGASLCVFEWNADVRGHEDTLLLAHATGFHARCWDQVVARLPSATCSPSTSAGTAGARGRPSCRLAGFRA